MCDFLEHFERAARSSNDHTAEPEYPAQEKFGNPNTFHFWQQHFDASTREQPRFDGHVPIRDAYFGRKSADYSARDQGNSAEERKRTPHHRPLISAAVSSCQPPAREERKSEETHGDEHAIRWNKSFDADSCVYLAAESSGIVSAIEPLPNRCAQPGLLEVVRAPFQREDTHPDFPDLLFFWTASTSLQPVTTAQQPSPRAMLF